uniref:Ras-associating domain-containing protein n=1 Tax=Timema shepardi TaxID=629360 RepID=A0A7R9AVY1_TIMSH|nr:unnamed protein product [Timema shepardi]
MATCIFNKALHAFKQVASCRGMTTEIPVWVNSRQRWVTGVNKKTTCDEVIAVLLGAEAKEATSHGYAIMERWRRVERPLDSRARILKVWEAWGDERGEVRLTLKRVDWEADSGRGSPVNRDPHRKRRHRAGKLPWPDRHETLHPRRLAQLHRERTSDLHGHTSSSPHHKLPDTIERLMRLILAQGETIQTQLRRLHDREHQIETLEGETHRARVEALGSNYLLETYLGSEPVDPRLEDEEKGNDSGVMTEGGSDQTPPTSSPSEQKRTSSGDEEDQGHLADESEGDTKEALVVPSEETFLDLRARVDVWEKLLKVTKRLEKEEDCLVRLHNKLRRYHDKHGGTDSGLRVLPEQDLDEESYHVRNAILGELERARTDFERCGAEFDRTSLVLEETNSLMDARRHYLRRLQAELEASDRETERLRREMTVVSQRHNVQGGETQTLVRLKSAVGRGEQSTTCSGAPHTDTDSNSDTGLSSLHSSSEEGVYILDTLV